MERLPVKCWFGPLLAALLAIVAFSPALRAGFVWDDSLVQTLHLPYMRSAADAFNPPKSLPEFSYSYYRPLIYLSYMAESRANEAFFAPRALPDDPSRAAFPHAVTLAAHALMSALVALLAARMFRGRGGAWAGALAAGLIFAVHTLHSESASTIVGRSDSFSALFLLAGMLLALVWLDTGRRWPLVLAGFLFTASFLSKETSFAGIVLLPALAFFAPSGKERPSRASLGVLLIPFAVAAVLYFGLRAWAGIAFYTKTPVPFAEAAPDLLKAVAFYLYRPFWPWPVSPYIPELPGGFLTAAVLVPALAAFAVSVMLFRRGKGFFLFCFIWFAASLLPSLTIVVTRAAVAPVADRYSYLPSVAFALLFGAAAARLAEMRGEKVVFAALAVIVVLFTALSFRSTSIWENDLTLWTAVSQDESASKYAMPWVNLGNAQLTAGDAEGAEKSLRRSLDPDVKPKASNVAMAYNTLGAIRMMTVTKLMNRKDYSQAASVAKEAHFFLENAAMQEIPDWTIYSNLGECMLVRAFIGKTMYGRFDVTLLKGAERALDFALNLSPGNPRILQQLAMLRNYSVSASGN